MLLSEKRALWLEKIRSDYIINSELHDAIQLQRTDDVKKALAAGADPNSCDNNIKEPALFLAVARGNIEITKLLLSKGANPNIVYKEESPRVVPLILAILYNRAAVCKVLLAYGANPNGPEELEGLDPEIFLQEKPVFHAAMGRRMAICRVLLSGDWREVYLKKVKKALSHSLQKYSTCPEFKNVVPCIMDFLGILHIQLDLRPVTNAESWSVMEQNMNPTLRLFFTVKHKTSCTRTKDLVMPEVDFQISTIAERMC